MTGAVEITGLRVERGGKLVIPGLDASIRAGRITGLLGPSGCGKTTLMRAVVGVQQVAGGAVLVLGRPAGIAELRHEVGYVTQSPSIYGDLTAHENLSFFASIVGVGKTRVDEVLEIVGLGEQADQLVGTMSGGEQARVSLATALLGSPSLLVLDEPTVGLDPVLREQLWSLFDELAGAGATLIVSSHVMDEAERCDELLLMREGELLATGTPAELCDRTGSRSVGDSFLILIREREGEGDPS